MSDIAPYPKLIQLAEYDGVSDIFSYIVSDYGESGICCRLDRVEEGCKIVIGDWAGEILTPTSPMMGLFMRTELSRLLPIFKNLGLVSAQFYFAVVRGEFVLVDILVGEHKYASPGMIEELFGKVFRIQETIEKIKITSDLIVSIKNGIGKYSGNIIIKPNRFRTVRVGKQVLPLYIRITR